MASTTQVETTLKVRNIGARTDFSGSAATDLSAEEDRFINELLSEGYMSASDAFEVVAGAAATMNVIVGSGTAKVDHYVVAGDNTGQGNYIVRLDDATKTIALSAADPTQERIDEIWLVVLDNAYDASGKALPILAVREGTPGGGAPGADAAWDAEVLLASVTIPAAAADIEACTITDEREAAALKVFGFTAALIETLELDTIDVESLRVIRESGEARDIQFEAAGGTEYGRVGIDTSGNMEVAAQTGDLELSAVGSVKAGGSRVLTTADEGSGNGLDADTLDGSQASAFAPASHVGSGGAAHADATTSVDGFMTAADKTKLDGIETGATADQTITAGSGLTGGGSGDVTLSHADTSSQASVNNSGGTVIQDITLDAYGHVTSIASKALAASDVGASADTHNHDTDYYTWNDSNSPYIQAISGSGPPSGGSNGDIVLYY